jgi:site-specific recombinase XerD
MVRDTFAVRYLQNGGHLETLQEMLGLNELASVKRYQRFSEKRICEGHRAQGHLSTDAPHHARGV